MGFIYAMSDIHGHLDIFKETLNNVDLQAKENKLILLGDYIDRGDKSCETLYFVKELSKKYPNQVVALMGNHELMFLEQLFDKENLLISDYYNEFQNYISDIELDGIINKCSDTLSMNSRIYYIYKEMISLIKEKHKELIAWLKTLPYYYETEYNQIYVHAGIDEESGEYWKLGYEDEDFCWKYPHVTGEFYKDIIAGHIGTSIIADDENYNQVFWDRHSHFYIDGTTKVSKSIPVLKYDTVTKRYSSFSKVFNNGTFSWVEYPIKQ